MRFQRRVPLRRSEASALHDMFICLLLPAWRATHTSRLLCSSRHWCFVLCARLLCSSRHWHQLQIRGNLRNATTGLKLPKPKLCASARFLQAKLDGYSMTCNIYIYNMYRERERERERLPRIALPSLTDTPTNHASGMPSSRQHGSVLRPMQAHG